MSSAGCRPGQALALGADAVCNANVRTSLIHIIAIDRQYEQVARWAVITTLDCLTEIVIIGLPILFISKNQIKSSKKRIVVFVFSFRLLVIGVSIGTTVTYFKYLSGSNLNIGVASTVVWQEVLLCVSLISASIPCLRTFLWAFMSTGLMTAYGNSTLNYSDGPVSHTSRQQQSVMRSQIRDEPQANGRNFQSQLRPDTHGYKVNVQAPQAVTKKNDDHRDSGEHGSVGSYGSEQYIIHHTTEFEIRRSPANEADGSPM